MYFRLYPSKNNTIYQFYDRNGNIETWSASTNTGANPIMELMDGKGTSKLLFNFDIPQWLEDKLDTYTYTANLKLWDAGTLFNPPIKLKNVVLSTFTSDFAEGDGYSFLKPKAKNGVSNYLNRQDGQLWSAVTFTNLTTYHLNIINEDLNFNVSSAVTGSNVKFRLQIQDFLLDSDNVYTKFIHSRHTNTVFKPFIEFIIEDEIEDNHNLLVAGKVNKLYLFNQIHENFTGTLTTTVKSEDGTITTPTVQNPDTAIYYIEITPSNPVNNLKDEYVEVSWLIDGEIQFRELIRVQSSNQIFSKKPYELKNLYYYVTTPYSNNIVRQNDIIPFEVVSEIRGFGTVVDNNYEYKVVSADGFEMVPWMPVSVYKDKMTFTIDTSYFFPELQYEVLLRNKSPQWTRVSHLTYKFKVVQDGPSHLRELSMSPYYSRTYFFTK